MRHWLAVIALLALSAPARGESMADVAGYAGADRTQKLIAGARKEGELTLYSSAVVDDTLAITTAFEKATGVKVKLWRGSSEDVLRRAATEQRAGRYDVDVAETAGSDIEGLQRERLLQELASPLFAQLVPQAVVARRAWVTGRLSIFTAAFNTNLIKPADAPKRYQDLLEPRWKGKLGIEADDANWFMAVVEAMGADKALPLFRDIVARNGMSVRKGHTLLANLIAAGEVPLGLTVYGYRVNFMKTRGAPIDGVTPPPVIALPTGIAAFVKAPHPHAAALYVDFFLTEGQKILLARGNVPTNRTVQEPPKDLIFVDVAKFLDQGDRWTKLFKDTFVAKAP
jgi:iron(III) transport system substrate-binding protein